MLSTYGHHSVWHWLNGVMDMCKLMYYNIWCSDNEPTAVTNMGRNEDAAVYLLLWRAFPSSTRGPAEPKIKRVGPAKQFFFSVWTDRCSQCDVALFQTCTYIFYWKGIKEGGFKRYYPSLPWPLLLLKITFLEGNQKLWTTLLFSNSSKVSKIIFLLIWLKHWADTNDFFKDFFCRETRASRGVPELSEIFWTLPHKWIWGSVCRSKNKILALNLNFI